MDLTSLLKGFAAEAGLGDVHQNSLGGCVLAVRNGGKIIVEPSESREWAYLSGLLCPTPDEDKERLQLYRALLTAHGRKLRTLRYCFAESLVLEQIIMSQRLQLARLDQRQFNAALVEFVQSYLYWRDEIKTGRLGSDTPEPVVTGDFPPAGSMRL
jgi:hypothetical protein